MKRPPATPAERQRFGKRHAGTDSQTAGAGATGDHLFAPPGRLLVDHHPAAPQIRIGNEQPLNRPIGKPETKDSLHEWRPISESLPQLHQFQTLPFPGPTSPCRGRFRSEIGAPFGWPDGGSPATASPTNLGRPAPVAAGPTIPSPRPLQRRVATAETCARRDRRHIPKRRRRTGT